MAKNHRRSTKPYSLTRVRWGTHRVSWKERRKSKYDCTLIVGADCLGGNREEGGGYIGHTARQRKREREVRVVKDRQ